jgi:hypothetical protein
LAESAGGPFRRDTPEVSKGAQDTGPGLSPARLQLATTGGGVFVVNA